jgi:hypothetical protein
MLSKRLSEVGVQEKKREGMGRVSEAK